MMRMRETRSAGLRPVLPEAEAGPDQLKAEIAHTREHMDDLLGQLGRKLKPRFRVSRAQLSRVQIPLAVLFLSVAAFVIFRAVRPRSKPKAWMDRFDKKIGRLQNSAKVKRLEVRSAGLFDQIRALRLAASVARSGKPAIYIVEPRKV